MNGQRHALLWLPQPNANYDPPTGLREGLHDLTVLSGQRLKGSCNPLNRPC